MRPFSPAAGPPAAGPIAAGPPADPPGLGPRRPCAKRFRRARERRSNWEGLWQECYDFALPQRGGVLEREAPGGRRTDRLFDGTAPDAVDQLAAQPACPPDPALVALGRLRPRPRPAGERARRRRTGAGGRGGGPARPSRPVELRRRGPPVLPRPRGRRHRLRCWSRRRRRASPRRSASRRCRCPTRVLEEGPDGRLDVTFRRTEATRDQLERRFPGLVLPDRLARDTERDPRRTIALIEAVLPEPPRSGSAYRWMVLFEDGDADEPPVARGRFAHAPFVNFRWLKAPGEVYGRSPVMKALPDIKTANKVSRAGAQERLDRGDRHLAGRRRRRAEPRRRQADAGHYHPQGGRLGRADAAGGAGQVRRQPAGAWKTCAPGSAMRCWPTSWRRSTRRG